MASADHSPSGGVPLAAQDRPPGKEMTHPNFCEGLRKAAGEQVKGATMVSVVCPGQLPANSQQALIAVLLAVANG